MSDESIWRMRVLSTAMPEYVGELVRCKDCEYARIMRPLDWRTGKPSTVIEEWYCQWHSNQEGASDIEPDGFCAWAVKRED